MTGTVFFRRAQHVVCYWDGPALVFHNYATDRRTSGSPVLARILARFDRWQPPEALNDILPDAASGTRRALLRRLVARSLLERSDRRVPPREKLLADWRDWNPAAGFFHFTTKDMVNVLPLAASERELRRKARTIPMPYPTKSYPASVPLPLPAPKAHGEFTATLLARRTWRNFSTAPLTQHEIGTLLALTWGIQRWGRAHGQGKVALKTSPSGGACHPGEVYLLALNVRNLRRGLYHYAPDRHVLERLRFRWTAGLIGRYLPMQPWFGKAAALFLMTVVFSRAQWRYPVARAYRAVLLDAGHLCQTFCLTATWLGLAPFCSMAFADSRIEKDLKIDGVGESLIYVAGVGRRPEGGWRPLSSSGRTARRPTQRIALAELERSVALKHSPHRDARRI